MAQLNNSSELPAFRAQDVLTGRILSLLSAGSKYYPHLYGRMMSSPAPGNVNAIWRVAAEPVDRRQPWIVYRGNPASGRLARDYASAGVISLERLAIDALQQQHGGRQAVAYALGSVAMVAELPDGFGDDPKYSGRYAVGMGIGRGHLEATAGIYVPDTGQLHLPSSSAFSARTIGDIANVPAAIPVP